jgi:hypothetical protein
MYRQVKGPSGIAKFPGGPSLVGGALMSLVRLTCSCPDDPDFDTFLALRRASKPCHDGPMEQVRGETSSRMRGIPGGLASKRAADRRAPALVSTIRKLKSKGFVSHRALADELNRKGIPAARGGRWHLTTVVRMLTRLGLITLGRGSTNNGLAHKQAADARATALASTIRKLRKAGFVSSMAIARELNEREIPTARVGKWHRTSVDRLLRRLEKLEVRSPPPPSDAEPK